MKQRTKVLLGIFLLAVITRIFLAFKTGTPTYESFYHLRHIEHITQFGFPLYNDPLSYGSRTLLFLPFFHYIMAGISFIVPLSLLALTLPSILISSLVFIVFYISFEITSNERASYLSAGVVGFLPVLFEPNSFSPNIVFLPLMFIALYSFLHISITKKEKDKNLQKYVYMYLLSFLLLCVVSPNTVILIFGFLIYIFLSFLERKRIKRAEYELMTFSAFFFLWVQFIFFKRVFLEQGLGFITLNIPSALVGSYFPVSFLPKAVLLISVIPLVAGLFIIYKSLFKLRYKKSFLLISFAIAAIIMGSLRLIEVTQLLSFLGIIFAILFAKAYNYFEGYIKQTKLRPHKSLILIITVIVLAVSTITPAVIVGAQQSTPSTDDILMFKWIEKSTPQGSTVLTTYEEGHLVTYFSERKNIIDSEFSLIRDIDERHSAVDSVFTTRLQTHVLDVTDKYDVSYIVTSSFAKEKYDLKQFNLDNRRCFRPVYSNKNSEVYLVRCQIKGK